jgi:hypothetical protein
MILMSRFRGLQGLTIGPMFLAMLVTMSLALLWAVGCARPDGPPSDGGTTHADPHQVPFEAGDGSLPNRPSELSAAKDSDPSSGSGLPFHDSQNLPAGTLLTVRLKNPIFADNPGPNATFEAVVDEPVMVAGNRLIPRGVTVAGRVESSGASNVRHNRGYVRLALDSIQFTDAKLPIQTSSLFVRGNAGDLAPRSGVATSASPVAIRLEKGRRLTFRLTEPAYLAVSQHKPVDR